MIDLSYKHGIGISDHTIRQECFLNLYLPKQNISEPIDIREAHQEYAEDSKIITVLEMPS
jgi:hypothetical protein